MGSSISENGRSNIIAFAHPSPGRSELGGGAVASGPLRVVCPLGSLVAGPLEHPSRSPGFAESHFLRGRGRSWENQLLSSYRSDLHVHLSPSHYPVTRASRVGTSVADMLSGTHTTTCRRVRPVAPSSESSFTRHLASPVVLSTNPNPNPPDSP
jgi:hypothetical protein